MSRVPARQKVPAIRGRANRRKRQARRWNLPVIHWRQVAVAVLLPLALVAASVGLVLAVDQPIQRIELQGDFRQVPSSALDATLRPYVAGGGFLSADLEGMRRAVEELPWVDSVQVRRKWPDGLSVTVQEQVPAALWGEDGLLNIRGELFVRGTQWPRDVLPQLSGPAGTELLVAARLQELRQMLAPRGVEVTAVNLDARGSWQIRLASGLEVRFGRRDVETRIQRFVGVLDLILAEDLTQVAYIDMRYSHGFAVGRARPGSRKLASKSDTKAEPNV